jgi:hypothetical protein
MVYLESKADQIAHSLCSLAGDPPALDRRTCRGGPNKVVVHYDKVVDALRAVTPIATRSFLAEEDALSFRDVCTAFHIYPAHGT